MILFLFEISRIGKSIDRKQISGRLGLGVAEMGALGRGC